jgi:ComF family protein
VVHVIERLTKVLLPPTCVLCGDAPRRVAEPSTQEVLDICRACNASLPEVRIACVRCAEPLGSGVASGAAASSVLLCGVCQRKSPRYDASVCALRYEYPVDHLIRAFKFHGRLSYGRTLAELLARHLLSHRRDRWPDLIVPVPLATARFKERGFNQAVEVGLVLERRLQIPLQANIVRRIRETREQSGLEAKERRKNLRGAFAVERTLLPQHVAIVDDVVTTGSTMNELARTLRRAGVERIEAWALARTAARR